MKLLKRILRLLLVFILLLLVVGLIAFLIDQQRTAFLKVGNQAQGEDTFLLTNVHVIPMNQDTVLKNKTVYIKDGLVHEVKDLVDIDKVETIDGEGKYLIPGLIDMHVHLWDEYELGLYLSYGVTAIRNVWGMPMHLRLKEKIKKDKIISPLFFTTGPKLTGPEFIGDDNLQLNSPEEAREKVASYKERGYDFIKTYYGLTEEIFDAVISQAKRSDMDIVAHPSQKVPYDFHLNAQIASIEHAEDIYQQALNYQLDSVELKKVVGDLAESSHTSFCPTLMAFYNIYNMLEQEDILSSKPVQWMNPSIKMVDSKNQFERWQQAQKQDPTTVDRIKRQHEFHLYAIKAIHEAGVNLICGTDAGIGVTVPGHSIHQELALYKEAGLSNFEVIRTATANPSKTHKVMNHMGTIEKGKVANFLLLDQNPLEELEALSQPHTVFVHGRRLDKSTLVDFKERARNRKNLVVSVLRYAENLVFEK